MSRIKTSTLLIHIGGWLIFLSLPVAFLAGAPDNERLIARLLSPGVWLYYLLYILLFYLHAFLLFPRLYLKRRYVSYFSIVILLLVLAYSRGPFGQFVLNIRALNPGMRLEGGPGVLSGRYPALGIIADSGGPVRMVMDSSLPVLRPPGLPMVVSSSGWHPLLLPNVMNVVLLGLLLVLGAAIFLAREWTRARQRAAKAEADRMHAELSFLRLHLNPHFLFNTLNNIYSIASKGDETTAKLILKLSGIMRYVTDEITTDLVPLESEMEVVRDYLQLQLLRLDKNVSLDFLITGNLEDKEIPPLILMTFVENAFKYGISSHEESPIAIRLFSEESAITFVCENKLFPSVEATRANGVGIANARTRLEHLYAGSHELKIDREQGNFRVYLRLPVK